MEMRTHHFSLTIFHSLGGTTPTLPNAGGAAEHRGGSLPFSVAVVCSRGEGMASSAEEAVPPTVRSKLSELDEAISAAEFTARSSRRAVSILLIRHGESDMNVRPGLICGRSNATPLTEKGKTEAAACGARLAKCYPDGFDELYSSTAERAKQTATIALAQMGNAEEEVAVSLAPRTTTTRLPEVPLRGCVCSQASMKLQPEVLEICMGLWTGQVRFGLSIIHHFAVIYRNNLLLG